MTLHEAALVLEEVASRHGTYPDLPDWDALVAERLAPAGLVGVPREDPWGTPYLYRVSSGGVRYLIASAGADGELDGGPESLERLLATDPPPPPAYSDDPAADLLFLGARASWCTRRCGFLRAPEWAGREWGGAVDWAPPEPTTASPAPPPSDAEASARGTPRCLSGEAAETWLTLRETASARSAERGRLTSVHEPLLRTGEPRLRRKELWVEVETPLGRGWVRARYLGPCENRPVPADGAAEPFEIDRLLGPAIRALAEGDPVGLAALAPPDGILLLPGPREPLEARELFARAAPAGLAERAESAVWSLAAPGDAGGAGPARPVRDPATGLTLWFARRGGRSILLALAPGDSVPRAAE